MTVSKEELRQKFTGCAPPQTSAGKLAEALRRTSLYREAKTVFMMPSPLLFQARINCLLDSKVLIMPAPALKLGFYRVKPFSIAFPDLAHGTGLKGITLFGKKIVKDQFPKLDIDLALTGCIAIDQLGQRLGEGTGFFDLSMGLLTTLGAVTPNTTVGCVGGVEQISQDVLPCDDWDVGMDFLLIQGEETFFTPVPRTLGVNWDVLEKKRIRKIEPLFHLHCDLFPSALITESSPDKEPELDPDPDPDPEPKPEPKPEPEAKPSPWKKFPQKG